MIVNPLVTRTTSPGSVLLVVTKGHKKSYAAFGYKWSLADPKVLLYIYCWYKQPAKYWCTFELSQYIPDSSDDNTATDGWLDLNTSLALEIFIDNKIDVKILSYLMHNGVVHINIYVWISHLIVYNNISMW